MSNDSPNFERRQHELKAVRRHVRRLVIETHRVKAHLARLEAELEDNIADSLMPTLRRKSPGASRVDPPHLDGVPNPPSERVKPALLSLASNPTVETAPRTKIAPETITAGAYAQNDNKSTLAHDKSVAAPPIDINPISSDSDSGVASKRQRSAGYRKTAPSILFSLAVHAVALVLCMTFGFVTLVQQSARLFASPAEFFEESPEEFSEVRFESSKLNDSELQNVLSESDDFNLADNLRQEIEPSPPGLGSQVATATDVGQLDALPSELGTLLAGAGSPSNGPPGGERGDAVFFGTRSQGNRIVFVVDNSSSMKDGRLEAAVTELVRSVEALSPRQAFYVIFVSDQTYPMFFPQLAPDLLPATAPNKKRLAEWLPKAILASGKNRELIKAMDLAASLRPHCVYLLWDGDMKYSEKVRTEVMTHLTRPNQWNFQIHTLGMGITSLDAEYNLTAIAQAHGGTYRRVEVPTNRRR
jgi:hypothetical protein